ncbi:rubredoxin [Clostridium oceanicum]
MKKYVCNIWSYVYNPNKGDSDNNIEPNTLF